MEQVERLISRKIIISEEISDSLAGYIIGVITEINDYDYSMNIVMKDYQPAPIEIYINSGGGSATAGNAIIGAIEMSSTPVVTYALGLVASMALAIFVSGDVRIAHRLCRFMYHSISYDGMGTIKDHKDNLREADLLQEMYNSIFMDRTDITPQFMSEVLEKKVDYFFSAKKAITLGVADELLDKALEEVGEDIILS